MELLLAMGVSALAGYLLGSINLAVIVSHCAFGRDVRAEGSGNAGTTNMLRTFGWLPAAVTFAGDLLKGTAAALLGRVILGAMGRESAALYGAYAAGTFALLGHMYPLYFRFRGGKGSATAVGVIAAIHPVMFLIVTGGGIGLAALTGYVSIGSLAGTLGWPLMVLGSMKLRGGAVDFIELGLACLLSAIVIFAHRQNIARLKNGTENKLRFNKK